MFTRSALFFPLSRSLSLAPPFIISIHLHHLTCTVSWRPAIPRALELSNALIPCWAQILHISQVKTTDESSNKLAKFFSPPSLAPSLSISLSRSLCLHSSNQPSLEVVHNCATMSVRSVISKVSLGTLGIPHEIPRGLGCNDV